MKLKISWLPRAALLCLLGLISPAFADDTVPYDVWTLSWAASTMSDDGSPLTSDLLGYYVYTGDSPDNLIPTHFTNYDQKEIVLVYPPGQTHFFAVTAVNLEGIESVKSPLLVLPRS